MAPLLLKQLSILLWKSWVMRKRHWISTVFELFFPLLLTLVMAVIQTMDTAGSSGSQQNNSDTGGLAGPVYFDDDSGRYPPPCPFRIDTLFEKDECTRYSRNSSMKTLHIYYAPNNSSFATEFMSEFSHSFGNNTMSIGLESEADVETTLIGQTDSDRSVGIVFVNDEDSENLKYKIRSGAIDRGDVTRLFPNKYYTDPYPGSQYVGDFARVQIAFSEVFVNYLVNKTGETRDTNTIVAEVLSHRMPYPKYLQGGDFGLGSVNIIEMMGMVVITGYVVMAPLIVKRICDEKAAKGKEMLKMMGLSDWVFWGSHFINNFSVMFFQSLFNALMLCYGFGGQPYVMYSNPFLIFSALLLYNCATILSSMALTTVFNRPVVAVVVSVLLFEMSHIVPWALLSPAFHEDMDFKSTLGVRRLSCFLPNQGIQSVFTLIGSAESYMKGVSWATFWDRDPLYGRFNVGYAMLMMLLSCCFYVLLIWYIDNVWPFQYGIPKPVYYPFMRSYWFPNSAKKSMTSIDTKEGNCENANHFEKEPMNGRVGIKCQHLQKVFDKKLAVNDVSLNIYSGQITVLLGHNGAGKTTTMNMITGIFPPTSGTAYVDGFDVRQQTRSARRSMALCPQDNILYNELDVFQHLKLYAVLKDHPLEDVENEVNKIIGLMSLQEKKHSMSGQLSGGMKRKLCLGIAMIANSKILILDEPTSGMDPEVRRHIWDVLQTIRSERTILLTTHYMEEADALGDRIAIMNEGMVRCCGTPMFLKKTLGAGTHLRIAKNSRFDSSRVLTIVRHFMPNAEIKSEIQSQVIYSLESQDNSESTDRERSGNTSSSLAKLFGELEAKKVELNIETCGLTVTTMEDVFLRVGNEYNATDSTAENTTNGNNGISGDSGHRVFQSIPKNSGTDLFLQQFKALFLKRVHFAKRYWQMIAMQTLLPSILFIAILLIDYSLKKNMNESNGAVQPLELNLNMYGQTQGFLKSGDYPEYNDTYAKIAADEAMTTTFIDENPDNWTLSRGVDFSTYTTTYLVGAEINRTSDKGLQLIAWFNNEALHSLPPSINFLYESILKLQFPDRNHSITLYNEPITQDKSSSAIEMVQMYRIVTCLLLVPLTVPFLSASYVLFPIHERISGSKLLQLMTGLSGLTFWSVSFLFDLLNHLLATTFIFIVFAIFDWNQVFMGTDNTRTGLFFLLFFFGFASIPLAYLTSLRLKTPSSGFAQLVIFYLVTGLMLVLVFEYLSQSMNPSSFEILLYFARLLPIFSMSFGIQKLYKVGSYQSACDHTSPTFLSAQCNQNLSQSSEFWGCCPQWCSANNECYSQLRALSWDSTGVAPEFTFLVLSGTLSLLLLWLIEGNFETLMYYFDNFSFSFRKPKAPLPAAQFTSGQSMIVDMTSGQWTPAVCAEDSDVTEEKQRINQLVRSGSISSEAIVVEDLTKAFGQSVPIQAVNHLSFGVHKEECFGLLGVNGAGKTTTFRMLTGDETVSEGNAWIQTLGLRQQLRAFQTRIGYCPQFDALLDRMTGRETLFMFCRLRGMCDDMIDGYVSELVLMVDLSQHVDKCTQTYSGGNRRKLSLAIALCAAPPVIFLDEPTSGVDPSARRKIWSTLAYLQERYGSAFILTSHSMEECEALCSRLAIMVNGQFQCFGSVQHLRTKFGQGFTVRAKLKRDLVEESTHMADIQTAFTRELPSAVLKDVHQCLLHYHITDTSMLWSKMFAIMEEMKAQYSLEDYTISDTTLEQIFLSFARRQR